MVKRIDKELDEFCEVRLDEPFNWQAHNCWSVFYEDWCQGVLGIGKDLKVEPNFSTAKGAIECIRDNGARSLPHLLSIVLEGHEVNHKHVKLGDVCSVETGEYEGSLKNGIGVVIGGSQVLVLGAVGFAKVRRHPDWKCYGRRD